jgi:Zn-dependent protease
MALNLIPLPPLDGGRIVFSLLPNRMAWRYSKLEPYGLMILIVLMLSGVLWVLLQPFLAFGQAIINWFL